MFITVRKEAFNALQELISYRSGQNIVGQCGAMASFVGSMRDFNENETITSMTLEHYPGMTEKHLHKIADDSIKKWKLLDVIILHRVGKIMIGEDIVLVATWSAHRKDAFESCRMIMEQLKSSVPLWKKEKTTTGLRWIEKNTPGF